MTHPDRVPDYLEHIADAIKRATEYMQSLENRAALEHNRLAQDAIVRNIAVIGEAASRIHKIAPDFEAKHPELPWIEMRGMRNKLIHDYFDIDWPTVWDTVKEDLPLLLKQIQSLLSPPSNET